MKYIDTKLKQLLVIVTLMVMTFIPSTSIAEEKKATKEALVEQLAKPENINAKRIPILVELVKLCWLKCPLEAELYGTEVLSLLKQYPDPVQETKLLVYLPRIYLDRGDTDTAFRMVEQGISVATKSNDDEGLALILYNKAIYYYKNDELVLALDIYQKLEATYKRSEDQQALGSVYNNLGNIQRKLGNNGSALEYYELAARLQQNNPRKTYYANTLMNIGDLYSNQGDYQQALYNINLGMEHLSATEAPLQFGEGLLRLANVYGRLGDIEKATNFFEQTQQISKENGYQRLLVTTYYYEIILALNLGDVDYAERAISNAKVNFSNKLPPYYHNALRFFESRLAAEHGNWQKAEELVQPLLDDKLYEQRFYRSLALSAHVVRIKEKLGKFEQANEILTDFFEQYRENVKANKLSLAQQYSELYKVREKERQIAVLQEQSAKQQVQALLDKQEKRQLIYLQVVLVILVIAALLFGFQRRKALQKEAALTKQLIEKKNQALADICHELRTPFSVLKLQIEALLYNIETDTELAHNRLYNKINELTTLITDIDQLAKADALVFDMDKQPTNVWQLLNESTSELEALFEEANLEFVVRNQLSESQMATVDYARIKQVVTNLLTNSLRYTDAPGKVAIAAQVIQGELVLTVDDSAPGVPSDQYSAIFERLFRVEKSRSRKTGGSGLGLSISKSLIELHGGQIAAKASHLGGLCITIRMPI
ncbi:ATP-binding protein [Thalassotalea agarivorans]|uniref:histidine kinase n=1 Tax=Thalassotalea agarivorans TaxID=349064 RepID=A0A1I0BIJ3_THASX|nr:ATP-binding protein [Thalassotalea agarivorans]SET06373.1 Signal transduction histidine kinase [Thalassotalea agarivorans]